MLGKIKQRLSRTSSVSSQEDDNSHHHNKNNNKNQHHRKENSQQHHQQQQSLGQNQPPSSTTATSSHHQATGKTSSFQAAGRVLGQNIKASLKNKQYQHQQHHQQNHQQTLERTTAAGQLSRFDACVEAADCLAATASELDDSNSRTKVLPPRKDEKSGLNDCSVLVSPDGDLLLVPQNNDLFKELMDNGKDEYESSIFLGNDIQGDASLNGFSAVGWSIPATGAAMQQTQLSMKHFLDFTESLVLARKELAARTAVACNDFRQMQPGLGGHAPGWELIDHYTLDGGPSSSSNDMMNPTSRLPTTQHRVGPLCSNTSTINEAICELERFHFAVAELESQRWRKQSVNRHGCLVALRQAEQAFNERVRRRQDAIQHTSSRVRKQEEELSALKKQAEHAWNAVYQAEDLVTKRVEEIMQQRSRVREKQRMEQIKQQHDEAFGIGRAVSTDSMDNASRHSAASRNSSGGAATTTPTLGATNEEIWNLVSAVAESMEDGSFEPVVDDLPSVPLSIPRDKSMDEDEDQASKASNEPNPTTITDDAAAAAGGSAGATDTTNANNKEGGSASAVPATAPPSSSIPSLSSIPVASREQIEYEVGLPQLRATAMTCDEMVADAADALMNLLTAMDTTRRSARVAAETSLLSACNAQAACLKSLVELERESLKERLKELESLEAVVDKINVRDDLNSYITADKKERGGLSALGDDDDGGIASALAILSRHVDGSLGYDSNHRISHHDDDDPSDHSAEHEQDESTATEDQVLERIFSQDLSSSDVDDISDSVEFLCKMVAGVGSRSRTKRSKVCYALNSKRSARAEIMSQSQFDALIRLFKAILTGCNAEYEGGVSNAKMCIMLSQTFYLVQQQEEDTTDKEDRVSRIYVKDFLQDHPIWEKDDFWDQALSQQISESLTHSGVMSNFERKGLVSDRGRNSEWTETRKTKWFDLSYKERVQAASQVQAVVFAQLGALAHSMMELGCGLERPCAFVRRMSIRHQLPSSQRTMLIQHLISSYDLDNDTTKDESTPPEGGTETETEKGTTESPPPAKGEAGQVAEALN